MFTCTGKVFSAKIDSRGRITIPSGIRKSYGFREGDQVTLKISKGRKIRKKINSVQEVFNFISGLEGDIRNFSYDGETLEVVINE